MGRETLGPISQVSKIAMHRRPASCINTIFPNYLYMLYNVQKQFNYSTLLVIGNNPSFRNFVLVDPHLLEIIPILNRPVVEVSRLELTVCPFLTFRKGRGRGSSCFG
jgi:hypothetical protein